MRPSARHDEGFRTGRVGRTVWGEEPPETARATIQTYVSWLRGTLGSERIEGEAPREALDVLDEALELWRGPALADLGLEPSLRGDIARLEELRLVAIEDRIGARLDPSDPHGEGMAEPRLTCLRRSHAVADPCGWPWRALRRRLEVVDAARLHARERA